jgi:hypothetical protein
MMDNDVKLCLEHWAEYNASNTRYAQVEIILSPFRAIRLKVGPNFYGRKEIPYFTRSYNLTKNGEVVYYDSYHL